MSVQKNNKENRIKMKRRDLIKGLTLLPLAGGALIMARRLKEEFTKAA